MGNNSSYLSPLLEKKKLTSTNRKSCHLFNIIKAIIWSSSYKAHFSHLLAKYQFPFISSGKKSLLISSTSMMTCLCNLLAGSSYLSHILARTAACYFIHYQEWILLISPTSKSYLFHQGRKTTWTTRKKNY